MRAADDDAPFSESMLEWLDEGDRMGNAPAGGPRPSAAHRALEAPRRRERLFIAGGLVAAVALVLTLHFVGGKKSQAEGKPEAPTVAVAAPAPAAPAARDPEAPPPASAYVPVAAEPAPGEAAGSAAAAPTPTDPAAAAQPAAAVAPAAAAPAVGGAPAAAAVAEAAPPAPAPAAAAPAPAAPPSAVAAAQAPAAAAPAPAGQPAVVAAPATGGDAYDAAIAQCRAHMAAGRISHAVTSCREAIDARPAASEALTLLAEAEFTRGHTGVALRLATTAAEANQNFADAYVIIGGVYQEKGKNAEARAAYEQYLALQPKGKHAADLRSILAGMP